MDSLCTDHSLWQGEWEWKIALNFTHTHILALPHRGMLFPHRILLQGPAMRQELPRSQRREKWASVQCSGKGKGYRRQRAKLGLETWTLEVEKVKTGHLCFLCLLVHHPPAPPPLSSLPSFLHFLLASFYFASSSLILGFLQNVSALLHIEEKTIRSKPATVNIWAALKTNWTNYAQTTFKTF